jgi:hypothetical protein
LKVDFFFFLSGKRMMDSASLHIKMMMGNSIMRDKHARIDDCSSVVKEFPCRKRASIMLDNLVMMSQFILVVVFFRMTQYNADAHNTHAHSPL